MISEGRKDKLKELVKTSLGFWVSNDDELDYVLNHSDRTVHVKGWCTKGKHFVGVNTSKDAIKLTRVHTFIS